MATVTPKQQQLQEKLHALLQRFLEPTFHLQNDTSLQKLLTCLSKVDSEDSTALLQSQCLHQWIFTTLEKWETTLVPTQSIASFYLNLTAILSKTESTFITYNDRSVYGRILVHFQMVSKDTTATIKLACLHIFSSFLEHPAGVEWIVTSSVWKDCLNFCLQNETVYITRDSHLFLYNLLTKTVQSHNDFCRAVVKQIYDTVNTGNSYVHICPKSKYEQNLAPVMRLIIFLLKKLMEIEAKQNEFQAVTILLENNVLEDIMLQLKLVADEIEFVHDVHAILIYIKIFQLLIRGKETNDVLHNTVGVEILGLLNELICVQYIPVVIRLSHLADSLWNYIPEVPETPPVTSSSEIGTRERLRFQNQLLIFEMAPVCGVCFVHIKNYIFDERDYCREDFISDFLRMMHVKTIRMGYAWRDILYKQEEGFQMAKFATQQMLRSLHKYTKSRAIMIFQVLQYTFKDILDGLTQKPELRRVFIQNSSFMITLCETIAVCINKFDLTWTDCVETITVMNNAIECVNHSFWPPRVTVHALKLVGLSIAKFLPPNMALLVQEDSITNKLGSMLFSSLFSLHWEIKDSALEILQTIAKISNSKYPHYQTMLLRNDIIPMIVTMATNDSERFVRVTAIKCLQEMTQVHKIWSKMLMDQNLPQLMMHILKYEPEGIIRAEAAKLMANIYEYQAFNEELMPRIFETMALASCKDLHWEVKSNALDFWGKVVLNHLQEQGYIDRKFPNVTFSKEKRKIVTLTGEEVQRRLHKVLQQLSEIGCLGVMLQAVQEDCDLEVSRKAVEKLNKMKKILEMYHLYRCYEKVPLPASASSTEPIHTSPRIAVSEEIFDSILCSEDGNLLLDILRVSEAPKYLYAVTPMDLQKELQAITPEIFITFLQSDLDAIVDERAAWLNKRENLDSLLDEMWRNYEGIANTMDCY